MTKPDRCYVCGGENHSDRSANGGHRFWSEADAAKEFADADRGRVVPSKEAAYVAQHRPY